MAIPRRNECGREVTHFFTHEFFEIYRREVLVTDSLKVPLIYSDWRVSISATE